MKRIAILLAVFVLVFALAAPAMAADPEAEIIYVDSVQRTIRNVEADAPDGYHVEIREADPDDVNEETLIEAASESELIIQAGKLSGYEVVDIVMVEDATGNVVEWDEPIRVAFTYDKVSELIAVFIQNDDESWSEVDFVISGDMLVLNLPHLTPVALTLGEKSPAVTPAPAGPSGPVSPQTGYDTVLWAVIGAVSLLAAGICLALSRRKTTAA